MKKSLFIIVAMAAFNHGFAQESAAGFFFNEKDSIQVSGKIIGYRTDQEDHFMTFSTYNLLGKQTNQSIQIANDGSFWIKLYQPFEGDIQLNYKDAYFPIYTRPGKTVVLDIYNSKVIRETSYADAFVAKGELAEINNLIFRFYTEFNQHAFAIKSDMSDKQQSDSLFAVVNAQKITEELTFLESFIKKNQVKNQQFINWQRNQLNYSAAKEALFFPFAGKFNKEISQKQLLNMIGPVEINNQSAFHNSAYYHFLRMLSSDQQIIININPFYEVLKQENKGNTTALCLDVIDSYAQGLTKELLYYYVFVAKAGSVSDPAKFSGRFEATLKEPLLKQQIEPQKTLTLGTFKAYAIVDQLHAQKIAHNLKQKLIKLFETYRGTALYIDFWGDWCGPCMSEMPNYPPLISAMAGKSLKFLFLSAFTSDKAMLATKEKFKINADFVNLTKDEVAVLNNVFGFHSYPSHFLINVEGKVIKEMNKLSIDGTAQKTQEIEQLLAKK